MEIKPSGEVVRFVILFSLQIAASHMKSESLGAGAREARSSHQVIVSLHLKLPRDRKLPTSWSRPFNVLFFFLSFLFSFIYGCTGSSLLCKLSVVVMSGSYSLSLWCAGILLQWLLLLFPWWLSSEGSACNAGDQGLIRFDPWVRKMPWRREWHPPQVFLPGESHGQRSLAGYSPWGLEWVGHDLETKQQTCCRAWALGAWASFRCGTWQA